MLQILTWFFMRIRWSDMRESTLKFKGIFEKFFLVVEVDNWPAWMSLSFLFINDSVRKYKLFWMSDHVD